MNNYRDFYKKYDTGKWENTLHITFNTSSKSMLQCAIYKREFETGNNSCINCDHNNIKYILAIDYAHYNNETIIIKKICNFVGYCVSSFCIDEIPRSIGEELFNISKKGCLNE